MRSIGFLAHSLICANCPASAASIVFATEASIEFIFLFFVLVVLQYDVYVTVMASVASIESRKQLLVADLSCTLFLVPVC